jgi:hypothetical protein
LAVPRRNLPCEPVEDILTSLHEFHEVCCYEAVERLVLAGAAADFDADTLLAMLQQGVPLQKLLDLIVSKTNSSQKAA